MTKGKIVLVPLPFDDLTASKVRPAVCLTEPIVLDPRRNDFAATGLHVVSVLRLHRLVTLTTGLIQRELGELSPALREETDKKLALLFGLKS